MKNLLERVAGVSVVVVLAAFLVAQPSCATFESLFDSGPSSDELRLAADDMRNEADKLAASGDADAASTAMAKAAELTDAAADAREGDISGIVSAVVGFIPQPYNTIATSIAGLGALWWGRRHQKANQQIVRGFPTEGDAALTDAQRESLSKTTTHATRTIISRIKSKDRMKAAKVLSRSAG